MTADGDGTKQLFLSEAVEEKPHRRRPPHVLAAILERDIARLSSFGTKGNRSQAEARLRAAAQKAASEARQCALIEEILEEHYEEVHREHARAHAMRNLAGSSHD